MAGFPFFSWSNSIPLLFYLFCHPSGECGEKFYKLRFCYLVTWLSPFQNLSLYLQTDTPFLICILDLGIIQIFIDTHEADGEDRTSAESRLFKKDAYPFYDKMSTCNFNRTSVSVQWKRETLSKSWSKWSMNGTTKHSPLAALKPVESSFCEEMEPQKSSPTWRTAWCCWAHCLATGKKPTPLSPEIWEP